MSPKELQDLRERMSKQSDKDLLKIINVSSRNYRKEAIELARGELEKRGLSHHLKISPSTTEILPQDQTKEQVRLNPNMETIECKFCGSVISATATECDSCGYGTPYGVRLEEEQELKEAIAKSAITLINCPACNSEVSNQAVACPRCGQPIKAPQPVKVSTSSTFIPLQRKSSSTSRKTIVGLGFLGFLIGGIIGFLLRPSAPFIGQLPFEIVITQGSNLRGLDQVLAPIAQASFMTMIEGAILGVVSGAVVGAFLAKKKS
ncbi:MAG: hypothetical protein QOH63_1017 [Acidobacteriota bacterium]|jgi:ribosomal protein L37E|nr:hypothetical protein [Acidobacteriota bacterium]